MTINDGKYLYQDFSAIVAPTYTVKMGTAVDFVPRTDNDPLTWNHIPLVKPAAADTNIAENDPRTTYIGVAMNAASAGESVTVRYWGAGTMPALVLDPHGHDAGGHYHWNGEAFVHDLEVIFSSDTFEVAEEPGDTVGLKFNPNPGWTPSQFAGKTVKITSGYHIDEFYTVFDNDSFILALTVPDIHDHWFPGDGGSDVIGVDLYDDASPDLDLSTAINMSSYTGAANPQIVEMLVLKGGRV